MEKITSQAVDLQMSELHPYLLFVNQAQLR